MVADVNDDAAIGSFHGVQLVILARVIAGAGRNWRQPTPGLAVILRFTHADALFFRPELFARIEQPAVGELGWSVGTVHNMVAPDQLIPPSVERTIHSPARRGAVRR